MMDALCALLQANKLFADVPEDILLGHVLPQGSLQEYRQGQVLILPQQMVDRFGLILRGKAQILHLFADGNHGLTGVLSPGDWVGMELVCTRSRIAPYHIRAATDMQLFYLPASLLSSASPLGAEVRLRCLEHMLQMVARENMRKEYRLAILSQNGLRERIVTYLAMQAGRLHKNSFSIPFSREEMAAFLCVNRSALSHELSRMQQEGLISFHKNSFTLHSDELFFTVHEPFPGI